VGKRTSVVGEVMLKIVGKETTWSSRFPCRGGSSEKSRLLFEEDEVLHTFPEHTKLDKDVYAFPFSFFLPGTIAPSMELEDIQRGGGCSIDYRLRVSFGPNIFTDRPVTIVGATLSKIHPYTLSPTCISPHSADGATTEADNCLVVAAKVSNAHVAKGQPVVVTLSCRNMSNMKIKRVDVSVVEEIQWNSPSWKHWTSQSNTLAVFEDVQLSSLVKIPEPVERLHIWRNSDHPARVDNMLFAEMHADICSVANRMEMVIPSTARDTYENVSTKQLIAVTHSLKISLVTRDKSPPEVSIPIKILGPSMTVASNHQRHLSAEKMAEVATTAWPKDAVPHSSDGEDSNNSCPAVIEEGPEAE
jgi:hypothetical protein